MSKLQLFAALIFPGTPTITLDGVTGILQSIERENSSGNDFNVTLLVTEDNKDYDDQRRAVTLRQSVKRTFFVHTE